MNDDLETFSSRLKYALEIKKVSQSELAKRIGVTRQAIQYLCRGNQSLSTRSFHIAVALDVDPYWLILGHKKQNVIF